MLVIFARAVIIYLTVIFSVRLMGKRQLGELQPSDLVTAMLISNIATLPIEDINIPMLSGIIPIFVLVFFELLFSCISMRSTKFSRILSGHPVVIIKNGNLVQKNLVKLRLTIDDLLEILRRKDIFDIDEVYNAVIETDGQISVQKKNLSSSKDKSSEQPSFWSVAINDGKLDKEGCLYYNVDLKRINSILKKQHIKYEDVLVMMFDQYNNYKIIKKENAK